MEVCVFWPPSSRPWLFNILLPKKEPTEEMAGSKVGAVCVNTDNSVLCVCGFFFFFFTVIEVPDMKLWRYPCQRHPSLVNT